MSARDEIHDELCKLTVCVSSECPVLAAYEAGRIAGLQQAERIPVRLGAVGDKSSNKVMTMWAGIELMRKAIRAAASTGGKP